MTFRYDYYPYNDTIAAEVYNNLYVRILGLCFSSFGSELATSEVSWTFYSLDTLQSSLHPFGIGNTNSEKGDGQLRRPM